MCVGKAVSSVITSIVPQNAEWIRLWTQQGPAEVTAAGPCRRVCCGQTAGFAGGKGEQVDVEGYALV